MQSIFSTLLSLLKRKKIIVFSEEKTPRIPKGRIWEPTPSYWVQIPLPPPINCKTWASDLISLLQLPQL